MGHSIQKDYEYELDLQAAASTQRVHAYVHFSSDIGSPGSLPKRRKMIFDGSTFIRQAFTLDWTTFCGYRLSLLAVLFNSL